MSSFFKKHPKFTKVSAIELACALAYSLSYIDPGNPLISAMSETHINFGDLGTLRLEDACLSVGILICILAGLILIGSFTWDRLSKKPDSDLIIYLDESITKNEFY